MADNVICAKLREVEYDATMAKPLPVYALAELLDGKLATRPAFVLKTARDEYGFSQWVSPKRTRTFPYARVYDTLVKKSRITLIPFCKDEGVDGDRDFIQWDTVSLMSLLNVYVIVGYYERAQKSTRPNQQGKSKITKQVQDYAYVGEQLAKLQRYQSSPLHWNKAQMKEHLPIVAARARDAYARIESQTGVRLHNPRGMEERVRIIERDVQEFEKLSRSLAGRAQHSESLTEQPKEAVVGEKAVVTIKNLLGGLYHLTADECMPAGDKLFLIEKKHSKRKPLPSISDIKDAFIKMALFANIARLKRKGKLMPSQAAVGLTSGTTRGVLHSAMDDAQIARFCAGNQFKETQKCLIKAAIGEARRNGFGLFCVNSSITEKEQSDILLQLIA